MNSGQNKLDSTLTGMWVNFFTTAGIPSDVAATYALTFTENRIQNDMLLDLNKEYLRDMGITRMGDVIAILRHAKVVHESTARDRVLSSAASGNKVPVAAVTGRSTSAQASSPASRMLEHYTRNHPAAAGQSPDGSPTRAPAPKRKSLETGSSEAGLKKARLIRFGSAGSLPQKVTSEVTTSKNVFSRLGNSDPSIPVLTKTVAIKNVSIRPETTRPIFARLGSKTASEESIEPIPKDALKYEGILKSDPLAKKTFTVTTSKSNTRKIAVGMGCTMRADEAPVSVKEKLALPLVKSVKFSNKVEYKEIEAVQKVVQAKPKFNSVFNKPERRLSMPEDNSIKSRLGLNARLSTAKGLTTTKELTATSTKGLTTTSTKGLNTIKGLTTKDLNTSKGLSKAKPKNVNNFTITRNVFNRLGI